MRIETSERILGVLLFSDFENVYEKKKILSQKLKNWSNQLSAFFFYFIFYQN